MFKIILSRALYTSQSLVPRRLILVYPEHENALTEALAQRIHAELTQVHLNVLKTDKLISSPQIPYTVVITKRTLTDGVLELHHYKPKVREEVHVSNLKERLLLCIK